MSLEHLLTELLDCTWGRTITMPGNYYEPCIHTAKEIVALHDGSWSAEFKLCTKHAALVKEQTDPRPPE